MSCDDYQWDTTRDYHWNDNLVCVDPDVDMLRAEPFEVDVRTAYSIVGRGWFAGARVSWGESGLITPVRRSSGRAPFATQNEARRAVLRYAEKVLLERGAEGRILCQIREAWAKFSSEPMF